jgi:Tfp pilus assembly protein PilW
MLLGLRPRRATCRGFSLIELITSCAILMVIVGGILSVVSSNELITARTEQQSDMYENVRGAAELMEQEIGQAGLASLPSTTLSAAVTFSATAQSVNVSSTTSMFVGENVIVDAGTKEELVALTAVTSTAMSGIFSNSHASGASVTALGVFPNGVVVPGSTDGSTSVAGAGTSVLNIFGDVNSDGSLVYVRYTCNTSTTPGTLTRSVTTITPGVNTIGTAQTLLSTLVPNPSSTAYPTGVPCFQYTTFTNATSGKSYVTNVSVTLSARTLNPDPQTNQYLTMTKSFLDMSPRNILAGFELDNASVTNRLQATPPNVLLY